MPDLVISVEHILKLQKSKLVRIKFPIDSAYYFELHFDQLNLATYGFIQILLSSGLSEACSKQSTISITLEPLDMN